MAASMNWWEDEEQIAAYLQEREAPVETAQQSEAVRPTDVDLGLSPEAPEQALQEPAETATPWWQDTTQLAAYQEDLRSIGRAATSAGSVDARVQRGLVDEFSAGLSRGIDQTQALGYGLLGLVGESLGVDAVSDFGIEGYVRNMEEAAKNQASVQDPFEEIGGVGDAGLYAAGILGEQLPQLLLSVAGGGIGGYAAKTVAKKVVANEIGKRVAAGMAKDEAEEVVAKLVAQKALRGFDVPFARAGGGDPRIVGGIGQEAVQQATRAGALGGAYVANVGQIAGGSFGEIEQETGLRDPVNALGFALIGGAVETAGEAVLAAPIARKLIGSAARSVEAKPLGFALGPKAKVAGQLAAAPAAEGATEYVQTGLEQSAVASADPNRSFEEVVLTPEAARERQIAAAAGAVAGGGFGAVSQAASFLIPETRNAVQRKLAQRQAEQGATEEDQSAAGMLTGDWSQPVQVDDVTMQRNSSGVWVAVNPGENLFQGVPRVQTEDGTSLLVVSPEADEQGRAAFLVARAEKALSDLDEGEVATEFQSQEEPAAEADDELGEPVELDEETEATRLRQSPMGATALREQLAEEEEVSAALADPVVSSVEPPAPQPLKSAAESAQTIAAELEREEEFRRSDEGAQALREQLAEEEEVSAALADPATSEERGEATVLKPASESAAAIQAAENAERTTANNPVEASYLRRRLAYEESQSERQKGNDEALARPLTQSAAFVDGLQTGQRVGLLLGGMPEALAGTTGVFVGRRKNGNAVFEASDLSPVSGDPIGQKTRVELKPSQFNRVILAPPPQPTRTPLEQAFDDALGPNPTKQQAERVLGPPYTGTRGAQESTFQDGLGSEPFPVLISWFNKKGEKGTIIPSIKGKFTNSALTTVRQMNQGLEIVVPDDQLGKISKDIQVEAVSDKKGGRKNIVTGVNLWGRTYRRSLRSPKDFSVDIPLTKRGAGARKQGLLLFDNIYKNSPERIARSEAAVRGAKERQTPPEQMLREWELVQAGLNPVEYAFYEDALGRATDYINRSNLPENVKDEARFEAQNNVVKAFANRKKRRGKQPAEGTAALAKTYLEELAKLRDGRLEKTRERSTRLIGNVERNRGRMSDLEIERGSIDPQRAAEIEERVIDEAMKGNEVDLDRAVEATLKRLATEQPNRKAREVFDTRKALRSIAESYKNIGKFNPIYTAMNAVRTADRSIRRREMNEQTELITDREARELAGRQRAEEPETIQQNVQGEIDRALQAETVQAVDRAVLPEQAEPETTDEAPEISPDDPMLDQVSDARERFFNLTEEDQVLVLSNRRLNLDERGRPIRGQKSNLTQAQKRRAKQIEQYLQRKQTYANLYPESPVAPQQPRRGDQSAAQIPVSRFSSGEVLAGVAESGARGRPRTDTQGRPESVGRPDRAGTGTVQGADNVRDGGPGVRASLAPQTVRRLSRSAKSRFVQSFGRLTDAEASALTEAEIDRAYEAIVTRKNAATVRANRIVSGETPRSLADLGTMSGSELLAGAVDAMRTYEADRARVQIVRDNVGALLRARAFADVSTFLGSVAGSNAPQDVKLRAREFSKLLGRGVDLNAVGVQIGRFGDNTSWAGLFTRDNSNTYNIALNLDAQHDRESAINTMLHELSHVVTSKKIRGEVRLNNVEQNAINRLEALRREALVAAARDVGLDVPTDLTDADYERLANDLDQRALPQNDPDGTNRVYASLGSLEEFTVEVSSSPELAGLMARLGFGQARGRVTLLNAIRDAWNALVELVSGVKADPNSPLARAFKDSWILNYSNAGGEVNLGDYTMPEIRRSAINRELARRQGIEDEITREVEARNLAGTTAEREAILAELFDPSVTASAARVQRAANRLSQADFVQWARKNGYNFTDPVAVYNNNRTTDQATGDTVQGAESRAVAQPSGRDPERSIGKQLAELRAANRRKAGLGLLQLAEARGENLFQLPRNLSNSEDLLTVLDSTGAQFALVNMRPPEQVESGELREIILGSRNSVIVGRQALYQKNDGGVASGTVVRKTNRSIFIQDGDNVVNVPAKNVVGLNGTIMIKEEPDPYGAVWPGKVWAVDSSDGNRDPIIDSTRMYQGLYQWAANTGQKIVPDSAGTSPTGSYRRNAQQISSALRLKSAEHFIPTDEQLDLMFPEVNSDSEKVTKWLKSDLEEKVGALALAEVGFVEQLLPDIVTLKYDPNTNSFLGEGESISRDEARKRLDSLLADPEAQDPTEPIRIGEATLVRYLASRSALQGSFGADAPVLRSESASLDKIAYSRARGWVTPQQDADYLAAVERGDMETAQRMVDEAARAAGYATPAVHGSSSDKEFTVFDTDTSPYGRVQGSYFTQNARGTWSEWLKNRRPMRVFLRFNNPATRETLDEMGYRLTGVAAKQWLSDRGYDGVVDDSMDEVVAFYPNQIKSADPVTYDDRGNVIPLSQRFNETSPDIRFSRARGRVWRPITKTTPTGGKITQGGMFSVDELLDVRAGDAYRKSRMAIKVDVSVIQELSRQLERQMKSLYKGQTPPLETLNTALGNLENPLTTQQLDEIEALVAAGRPKQAGEKKDQFLRENRKRFKEVTQPAALAQLPEEIATTIREMSAHIESLSRRLPNEGLVNGDLAISVDEALGTYLNRSYAIFDDPQWADRVRKNAKVMDAARKFIRNGMVKDKANELIVAAQTEGRTVSTQEALARANDSVTEDQVEGMLESYLAIGDEAPSVELLSGRIPGQKNLSIFYKRGNIAPEIQDLWGRYEDPAVNYAKTVMKLSSLVANDRFLKELRDMGLQEGWLWSRENNPDDLRHPPGYIRISTDNNPTLAPIAGMYAHPMLAEGLFKMFPVGSTEEHYWWLRSAMKLTGVSMAMKTVGSVASQVRNYLGNYLNLIAGGNLGLGDIASGDFAKRFRNSTDLVLANTFNKYRNATRAEWRAKIDDYIRRGVVGESITTGLLEDLLTASRRAGSPDWGDYVWGKVSEPVKRVADFATRTYSAGDDWFKVMIYEAEQDKYRKAYPDWSDDQVKQKAAEIARDIHWTYSLAPAVVDDLKKFPFVAPFVTFTTEVIRTTYNLQKLARQEIMEGRATGNKELENIGWKRVRGMTTAAFLPAAVGSASMAIAGISGEDEEDLRRFLPDWQKNSQLLVFRKADGQVSFVDVSFLDPYEYFKKPLVAFARSLRNAEGADEILLGGTMAMVRQAVDPFTSEQIFSGAILDVMRNRDAAGRQVYNPQDTGANIGTAVARKIFIEPFTPGTFTSLDRIGKAAFGIQSETGRAYGLFNELASVMAGQRVSEMDAQQALQFKGSGFMREIRDASALFNKEFVSRGTRSASDVVSGYERSNAARRALIEGIRNDYLAAIRLGVPVARAKAILRDAGLGRDTLRMVTTGIYKPFEASEQSLDLVRSRGNADRISAYNQAKRNAPPREVLP